jgi:hypothetical protein
MNLFLNKDLKEIYDELLEFSPKSSILTRK